MDYADIWNAREELGDVDMGALRFLAHKRYSAVPAGGEILTNGMSVSLGSYGETDNIFRRKGNGRYIGHTAVFMTRDDGDAVIKRLTRVRSWLHAGDFSEIEAIPAIGADPDYYVRLLRENGIRIVALYEERGTQPMGEIHVPAYRDVITVPEKKNVMVFTARGPTELSF